MVMKVNGSIDRLIAKLEAAEDRELERLQNEMVDLRVKMALLEHAKANAEQPRRSAMSPLEKSRFIRAHGKAVYDQLDW